ncbi:MAG: HigA family addiction module antitoxin [Terriglobales bacterium]
MPANAVHPGEILREEFMVPLGLTSYRLAKDLNVPLPRVNDIVLQKRAVTADMALRLARYFGTTPQTWMNLQTNFDLDVANVRKKEIANIRPRTEATA